MKRREPHPASTHPKKDPPIAWLCGSCLFERPGFCWEARETHPWTQQQAWLSCLDPMAPLEGRAAPLPFQRPLVRCQAKDEGRGIWRLSHVSQLPCRQRTVQSPVTSLMASLPLCSPDEDSCQKFVPFVGVSVVKVGQLVPAREPPTHTHFPFTGWPLGEPPLRAICRKPYSQFVEATPGRNVSLWETRESCCQLGGNVAERDGPRAWTLSEAVSCLRMHHPRLY